MRGMLRSNLLCLQRCDGSMLQTLLCIVGVAYPSISGFWLCMWLACAPLHLSLSSADRLEARGSRQCPRCPLPALSLCASLRATWHCHHQSRVHVLSAIGL